MIMTWLETLYVINVVLLAFKQHQVLAIDIS